MGTQLCPTLPIARRNLAAVVEATGVDSIVPTTASTWSLSVQDVAGAFGTRHHSPLRPRLDEHQPCGNPLGSAPLPTLHPERETDGCIRRCNSDRNTGYGRYPGEETSVLDGALARPRVPRRSPKLNHSSTSPRIPVSRKGFRRMGRRSPKPKPLVAQLSFEGLGGVFSRRPVQSPAVKHWRRRMGFCPVRRVRTPSHGWPSGSI